MKKRVALIIRDGWALNENTKGNAVAAADTPNVDGYKENHPWALLECSGEPVGLPPGYMGSSEVGHLNIGAGRIVVQELKRIDDELKSGELFAIARWKDLIGQWKQGGKLHMMGLLQNEGVHAHQEHLFAFMRQARKENPSGEIVLHLFLDGRDTPPRSCLQYMGQLEEVMNEVGGCRIGTIMGRYYSMDRSRNWGLTDEAFRCIVEAQGRNTDNARAAIEASYASDKTPDGVDMFDEYVPPHVVGEFSGIKDGDCVIHTNYRQDRAIQLTKAFVEADYAGKLDVRPKVTFLGLTRYYDEFPFYLMEPMDEGGGMENLLGEVVSAHDGKQLRIAETQKFPHVTSFFNGKSQTPFPGEDQVEVPSRFDPASFASHPEMEAYNVTDEILRRLEEPTYDLIVVNYANGDMVGHTGDFDAAKRSVEIVDECVGKIVARLLELDYCCLITADHGNADQMIDYETGQPMTSHTLYPVEFIYVKKEGSAVQLKERGKLGDIAPTILNVMGLPVPPEMTGDNLVLG